jgi:hypothetical protein
VAKRTVPNPVHPSWPWRRRTLTIPPDSLDDWLRLAFWESWMGGLLCCAVWYGTKLIVTAPGNLITVFDFTNCYAVPVVVLPCERVAYRTGTLNVALNIWCGVLLISVALWVMWELWNAVVPKPITDDFLKLLDDSFARDWRRPLTWPWARMGWAYGFTFVGVTSALGVGLLVSTLLASSTSGRTPTIHIDTSQQFRVGDASEDTHGTTTTRNPD